MLKLTTERLIFKRYTMDDLPFIVELVQNPIVMKYIGNGQPKDEQYAIHFIERMLEQYKNFGDYGIHLLVHKETGKYIGHAGIVAQIFDDAFELELGYWIQPEYFGQGYGKEAANALARYADEEIELERYVSAIQVGNIASEKIAKSNGMHMEKIIEMEGKQVQIFVKENPFNHDEEV